METKNRRKERDRLKNDLDITINENNSNGNEEHVRGPGVVGQQPVLRPGESFRYTSGCPMDTAMGTMHGSYQMLAEGGDRFDAEIAPFTLAEPYALN